MNDNDRTLIQQILSAAGKAGEQGFGYLVHWQFVDGLTSFLGFGLALAGALWGLRIAFRWSPEDEDVSFVRGAAIVVLCVCAFGFLCGMQGGVRDMLAPEGAAIYVVLHH